MPKGSAPAGTTTTQQVNPTAEAQLPYLKDIFGAAQNIYRANPQSGYLREGYEGVANTGKWIDQNLRSAGNIPFLDASAGKYGVQNSPAYGGYQSYATGQAAPQQAYNALQAAAQAPNAGTTALAGQSSYNNPAVSQLLAQNPGTQALAQAAQGQGMGLNALANTASGAYLNSNPYLDAMYRAAADPVTRAYQTSTAPTTDAAFSGGGRYGSGAAAGARDTNELNLGNTLANLSTNIYGQNYARERQAQDAAAGNYQQLINQAGSQYGQLSNQAAGTAGQLINQAALGYGGLANQGLDTALRAAAANAAAQQYGLTGLQGGYNTGNAAALQASQMYPQLAQANLIGPQSIVRAGQGLTSEPWAALDQYRQAIGAGYGGSANTTSPYFQNPTANALAGVSGALGIGNQLFGSSSGGLLGGLGGLGGLGTAAGVGGDFGGGGALLGIADTGFAAPLAEAGTAAAATGWIICTELTRQKRMPKRYYIAGLRAFLAYPEIARRGYHVWAIPSVRHLRRKPNSFYSRILATAFLWRAEDIAARTGVKGARKLWRGRAVTAALVLPCLICGALSRSRDWQVVYREQQA